MERRHWLGIVGVVVLLLAGVSVYVYAAGQNAHGSAAWLDVEPAEGNVSANETVAYEALSPAQQDLFERARNTSDPVEISPDVSYDVFVDYRYVRYQNRTYDVAVMVS